LCPSTLHKNAITVTFFPIFYMTIQLSQFQATHCQQSAYTSKEKLSMAATRKSLRPAPLASNAFHPDAVLIANYQGIHSATSLILIDINLYQYIACKPFCQKSPGLPLAGGILTKISRSIFPFLFRRAPRPIF